MQARLLTQLGWPMDDEQVVERWMGRSSAAQLADIGEHLGEKAVHRYAEGGGMAPEESLRAAGAEVFGHMSEVPGLLGLADRGERTQR